MIEEIITSKTRVKLLKLFLANIDKRYYLRELERMLDESLSPLRRQLMKLTKMGILKTEYEANLKYYRLNKDFAGIDELRRLVLGKEHVGAETVVQIATETLPLQQEREITIVAPATEAQPAPKRVRYDIAVLAAISFFVLATAIFVVYTSNKNIRQVAGLASEGVVKQARRAMPTRPDEMTSRRWRLFPGNIPVLSSGVTGGDTESEEL